MNKLGLIGTTLENPYQPDADDLVKHDGTEEDFNIDESKLEQIFRNAISENAPPTNEDARQITLLIVIPTADYDLYATIKRVAELQMGLKTVCCAGDKMVNFGRQKKRGGGPEGIQNCANIALKLNIKGERDTHRIDRSAIPELYGSGPVALAHQPANTIVLGADVTHPMGHCAPACPSIAAVVGSVDDDFGQFPGSMRLQRSRQEVRVVNLSRRI